MIAPVRTAFPLTRRVVFLSWGGERSKLVADALRSVIEPRLPAGAEIFFSPQIRPGAAPLVEMLDKNLLGADVHVVVLTTESVQSPWVTWETASSWARGKAVIPVFVDISPGDVAGPLTLLAQGVYLDDLDAVGSAIGEILSAVDGDEHLLLTDDERGTLTRAAAG